MSGTVSTKSKKSPPDMSLIASFARIKPLGVDKSGGVKADKQIDSWSEAKGTVTFNCTSSKSNHKVFDHMARVIGPEATQEQVYEVIARPLVQKWLNGYDADIISYGQTGSGKTYTMFGPPFSMEKASKKVKASDGAEQILRKEHGFILRSGLEALAYVNAVNAGADARAAMYGSMVEMSIESFQDQTVQDLLNRRKHTYIDKQHHLQGAKMKPIRTASEVVGMAAAVETRLCRGTRMNDTSSRSHCVALFTLYFSKDSQVRVSRLMFFDLMGSERFKGANAAHDTSRSTKSTMGGFEGIMANLSLAALNASVKAAAEARRRRSKKKVRVVVKVRVRV